MLLLNNLVGSYPELIDKYYPLLLVMFIIYAALFISLLVNLRKDMSEKIFAVHGISLSKGHDNRTRTLPKVHFHNTDLLGKNYELEPGIFKDGFEWINKNYLFVPYDRLASIKTNFFGRKATVYIDDNEGTSSTYKVKSYPKDWLKHKLSKSRMTNNTTIFIVGNVISVGPKISSITFRNRTMTSSVLIKYTNGSENSVDSSLKDFLDSLAYPGNISFLDTCAVLELV